MYKTGILFLLLIACCAYVFRVLTKKQEAFASAEKQSKRPQTPQPPFPYREEEVSYKGGRAEVVISGTLTLPQGHDNFPIVLLITGYGRYDRNLETMGHKYFLVLADYLTRHGIGVLRVDKRGVGKSSGDYESATSADFADDVRAGIAFLKSRSDLRGCLLGLIGLSEGGLIATLVAAQLKEVDFVVLMAPAVLNGIDDMIEHSALQLAADGASEDFIAGDRIIRRSVYEIVMQKKERGLVLKDSILEYWAQLPEAQKKEAEKLSFAFTPAKVDMFIRTFNSPWYRFFLSCDAKKALLGIQVPVLVVNGERDWIVPAFRILPYLKHTFEQAGNKKVSLIELPHLNHLFQTCKTGALCEYAQIEETMAPRALDTITRWILKETISKE